VPDPDPPRGRRTRPGNSPVGRLMGAVVPSVVDSVDIDEVVSRIDVDGLVARIDIDALAERLDMEALLDRIDVNRLIERIEPDALLDRVDVNRVLDRVTVDDVLDRVDPDRLLDRVGVDRLLDRIDVDRLLARADADALIHRVDLDAVMARIDLDAVMDRVDVDKIVDRADLAGIVAESTRGVTASALDLLRRQVVGIDEVALRLAARLVRRDPSTDPAGPVALAATAPAARRGREAALVSGHYAGPVSRGLAYAIDVSTSVFLFGLATASLSWLVSLLFNREGELGTIPTPWSTLVFLAWLFVYFAIPMAVSGRTFGKTIVGVQVVQRDGAPLRAGQAVVRVLTLPLSLLIFGLGLIGVPFGREHRALHDVIAGSAEVIDWGDRPAELPGPLSSWLARRADVSVMTDLPEHGRSAA